jgi:hypothetical protein
LIVNFLLIPAVLNFVRKKYFPEPNSLTAFFYFVLSTFIFELVLMINFKEFDQQTFLALAYFVVQNTIAGVLIFAVYLAIRKRFVADTIKF